MVRLRIFFFLIPLLSLLATAPASAQGILEQMENDVSAIVHRTKSAVVSIYDARIPGPISFQEMNQEQRRELNDLQARRQSLNADIARLQTKLKAGEIQEEDLTKAQQKLSGLDAQINANQQNVTDAVKDTNAALLQLYAYQVATAPKSGSGFSIGDGYIVTTADVLEGMQKPVILTDSGLHIEARIVGIDPDFNIGLLQSLAKEKNLPALELGDSASVVAGHFAICIGNQSGEENSVALMMVGGIRDDTYSGRRFYPSLIQIAGTVGAGTSGAPLVDSRGRVIGMMAAIPISEWTYLPANTGFQTGVNMGGDTRYARVKPDSVPYGKAAPNQGDSNNTRSQQNNSPAIIPPPPSAGTTDMTPGVSIGSVTLAPVIPQDAAPHMQEKHPRWDMPPNHYFPPSPQPAPFWRPPVTSEGFAIPINDIRPILDELRSGVRRERVWIGLGTNDEINTEVKDNILYIGRTVLIQHILPNSPAAHSGIQPGDYLVRLDDRPIYSAADVRAVTLRLRPGQIISVVVKRGEDMRTYTLKAEVRPEKIEETDTQHPNKILPKPTPMASRALLPASNTEH